MDQGEQDSQHLSAGGPPLSQGGGGEATPPPAPSPTPVSTEEKRADAAAGPPVNEPPVFGGRNPSRRDWFVTHEPEPEAEEPEEAVEEPSEELAALMPSRQRREAFAQELISPFAVLLFFVFSLLVGIATVNISIPASATVRAVVRYANYRQLEGHDLEEFQLEQDRLLRSPETRSIIANAIRRLPGGAEPNFATDDLEFHHRLDRSWASAGTLTLTLQSPEPRLDARRLSLLAQAMIEVSGRSKLKIGEAKEEINRLQQEREKLQGEAAGLRQEIETLEPTALKQSSLAEAALAMEQYLSLLEKGAPQRVAAEANLKRLREEASAAREAGEKRDALARQRMAVQLQMGALQAQIEQQEKLIARVVYPEPLKAADVSITDLRPARYNLLWIVTLGISGLFVVLLILSFIRNAHRELREREARKRPGGLPGLAP